MMAYEGMFSLKCLFQKSLTVKLLFGSWNPSLLHQVEVAGKSHSSQSSQLGKNCTVLECKESVGKYSWTGKDQLSEQDCRTTAEELEN